MVELASRRITLSIFRLALIICLPSLADGEKCPTSKWDGIVDYGAYEFLTNTTEGLLGSKSWTASSAKGVEEKTGKAIISVVGSKYSFYKYSTAIPGFPHDDHLALSFTADFSGFQLTATEGTLPKELKRKAIEIVRISTVTFTKLASLFIFKDKDKSTKGYVVYQNSDGTDKALIDDLMLINTAGEHSFTLGLNGVKSVYLCQDDVKYVEKTDLSRPKNSAILRSAVGLLTGGISTASGRLILKRLVMSVPKRPHLYVAKSGSDDESNLGTKESTPLKTIVRAAEIARAGTTVHIKEGVYRGTISLKGNGKKGQPIVYVGEQNPSKVAIVGSLKASELTWYNHSTNSNITWTNLDSTVQAKFDNWEMSKSPEFVCGTDGHGNCLYFYHVARTPNYYRAKNDPYHAYKFMQFWNLADGGKRAPICDPRKRHDCDDRTWDYYRLTDVDRFPENGSSEAYIPSPGIQPAGNFKNLKHLVGADITICDGQTGFYTKTFTIKKHDRKQGYIILDSLFDSVGTRADEPGLRSFAKYYVWNKLAFLDSPGEYFYDTTTKRLYIWKRAKDDWENIEISGDDSNHNYIGVDVSKRSHIEFRNLSISLFTRSSLLSANKKDDFGSQNIVIDHCHFHCSEVGLQMRDVLPENSLVPLTRNWTFTHSNMTYMRDRIIHITPLTKPGARGRGSKGEVAIRDLLFAWNKFSNCAWLNTANQAILVMYATNVTFVHNTVNMTGSEGLRIEYSDNSVYDKYDHKEGSDSLDKVDSLVAWNYIDRACEMKADCGAMLTTGRRPFNVLTYENVITNSFGYTGATSFKKETAGSGTSLVNNHCYGGVFFRNFLFNFEAKGFACTTKQKTDTDLIFLNNVVAKVETCIRLVHNGDRDDGGKGLMNYYIKNNFLADCSEIGLVVVQTDGLVTRKKYHIDYNYYYRTGQGKTKDYRLHVMKDEDTSSYADLAEVREAEADNDKWATGLDTNGNDNNTMLKQWFKGYVDEKVPDFKSVNDRKLLPYNPEWFRVDKALIKDHRSDPADLPSELERLLRHYSICVPVSSKMKTLPVGPYSDGYDACYKDIGKVGKTHVMFPEKKQTSAGRLLMGEILESAKHRDAHNGNLR